MLYQISYQEVSVLVEFSFFYRVVCPFHASNRQYKIFILRVKCQIAQHVFKRNFDRFLIAGHSSIIIIIIIIIITQQQQQQVFISHKNGITMK